MKYLIIICMLICGCSFGDKYLANKKDTPEELVVKEQMMEHDAKIKVIENDVTMDLKKKEDKLNLEHNAQVQKIFPTRTFIYAGLSLFVIIALIGILTGSYVKGIVLATGISLPLISIGQFISTYPNIILVCTGIFLAICLILGVYDFIIERKNRKLNHNLSNVQDVANNLSQAIELSGAIEVKDRIKENKEIAKKVEEVCRKAINEVHKIK